MAGFFGGEPGEAAPLDAIGELSCFLARRNSPPFAALKRRFRLVDGRKDFRAPTLTPFPQREGVLQGVFLPAVSSALNSLANERFLVVCELHFHMQNSPSTIPDMVGAVTDFK